MNLYTLNDQGKVELLGVNGRIEINPDGGSLTIVKGGSSIELSAEGGINATTPNGGLSYDNQGGLSVLDPGQTPVFSVASDGKVGFFGKAPIARPAFGAATADSLYGTTERDMLQKVYDALRAFGLAS